ncbi:translocation/assembly module TamB domain-containing protein [Niabella beijingensis]|uniref:translocation/assembly module TamB domain-containing protein n=1 Tax=Niabella beijingensis TaxID=2872700 RepID=UPI001CBC9008|nr:translocation/assembly module TamB domain-containing protein [Niabella beijingensis]MBZ4187757.1 translocation/assembly module TamB domain-containing protein [Niabella beijingensis]
MPGVQNWLISKVTKRLSKDLQTRIDIRHVDFSLFNKMHLQGVLVEDRQKDTILSAGEITVNITDWFFIKKNIELKYIGLTDAYIQLQRTDSVWRYQFLLDYFSTPASKKPKKQGTVNIAFREVDLKNILLKKKDRWTGEDLTFSLASLHVDPKKIDFDRKLIDIDALTVNKPYVALHSYDGRKPETTDNDTPRDTSSGKTVPGGLEWNSSQWEIKAGNIAINDGTFKTDNDTIPPAPEAFDGKHIEFSKIDIDLKSVRWWMDTITTKIDLTTKERSGLEVKKLAANAKVTPKEITFNDLDLRTNDSRLSDYFSMKFAGFSSMSNFISEVHMEGRFKKADINSDDIAFFAPAMRTWKKKIILSGDIKGPVAALVGRKLEIQAGNNTYFAGDASLSGLPDINETFMDIKAADFRTTYADALAFAPDLKKISIPDLSQLKYLNFVGSYTGFIRDFVTFGTLRTGLGTVKTDVNMKIPKGGNPVYSGSVATDNFNLGPLLKNGDLGYVSFNAKLKGAGFNPESGSVALSAKINYVDFNKYRYQNITADGEINNKVFDGKLGITDPNADLDLNGLVDFSKPVPVFNFISDIRKIHFRELNLLQENLVLSGKINAAFTGKSIDDFLGHATITDAVMVRDSSPLSFDSLAINSSLEGDKKRLSIASNEFSVNVFGIYNIRDLPNSVIGFLNRYYPAYIKPPTREVKEQAFSFEIKTQNFDSFTPIIDSSLGGFNNAVITGSINTFTNSLMLDAEVPFFSYDRLKFNDVSVTGRGNYDSLSLTGRTTNILIGDSLNVPLALFNIAAKNDVSRVMIYSGGTAGLDQARLNTIVRTYSNGVKIEFAPSSFVLNGKTWTIDNKGELEFRQNVPAHGQLVLRENAQEIRIRTLPSDVGSWNDIAVTLKDLNLGDLSKYIVPNNRLEGMVSGDILLENPGKNMRIISDNFMGRAVRFDNDSIGDISAKIVFDLATMELMANGQTLHPQQKDLAFNINLFLKDRQSQEKNIISLNATSFDIKYINRFLGFLFSDMQGEITGKFDLKGPFDNLNIVGKGRLHKAGLRVNFTQCYYALEDNEIELKENEINLDGIVLRDTITNNPVYLQGNITHNAFKNMFFDVNVSTRKPGTRGAANNRPVQVLNTTYSDNKTFYGNVRATGSFSLVGPEENAYMKIDAIASYNDESTFTIASSSSKAGQMPDWLVERKYGEAMDDSVFKDRNNKITYDLDVTANPKVEMKFVMDDLTGDEIKGRGSGKLNIHSGTTEPLSIHGRFDITEGSYNYTFQSFFKKPFEIKKGGENYISWTGDPIRANLNLEAQYKAERVSFSPLSAITNIDQSYSSTRENVYVTATLTGLLSKPDFKFQLELDPNSKYRNDFNITNALLQIENNETEVTRQVTYLIVFNSFAPPETGSNFGSTVNEFTYNTISSLSGLFFNEINKKLNNELRKILGADVSVVFNGSVYNRNILSAPSSNFDINQANVNGAILVPLFKDRFVISLGSSMEVPLQSSIQQTVQFLPDVTAAWMLNQSGSIRLNFFYRENLDYLTTNSTGAAKLKRTGGGISFRKEFDTLGEIFRNVRRQMQREIQQSPVRPDSSRPAAPDSSLQKRVEPAMLEQRKEPLSATPEKKVE